MDVHALSHVKSMDQGWTLPQLFNCDDGYKYVVKLMNNKQGLGVLPNEYIACKLARLLNLPVAEYKIVHISSELVEMFPALKRIQVPAGPHIGCRFAERAEIITDNVDLSSCRDIETMAGIIVFDHWIKNWDRYDTVENLLFNQDRKKLLMIDHANAFCGSDWDLDKMEKNKDFVETYWGPVYEMFMPYIDGSAPFESYLTVLEALDKRKLEQAVKGMPKIWGISKPMLKYLVEFLYYRKDLVRGALLQLQDEFPIWSKS